MHLPCKLIIYSSASYDMSNLEVAALKIASDFLASPGTQSRERTNIPADDAFRVLTLSAQAAIPRICLRAPCLANDLKLCTCLRDPTALSDRLGGVGCWTRAEITPANLLRCTSPDSGWGLQLRKPAGGGGSWAEHLTQVPPLSGTQHSAAAAIKRRIAQTTP